MTNPNEEGIDHDPYGYGLVLCFKYCEIDGKLESTPEEEEWCILEVN